MCLCGASVPRHPSRAVSAAVLPAASSWSPVEISGRALHVPDILVKIKTPHFNERLKQQRCARAHAAKPFVSKAERGAHDSCRRVLVPIAGPIAISGCAPCRAAACRLCWSKSAAPRDLGGRMPHDHRPPWSRLKLSIRPENSRPATLRTERVCAWISAKALRSPPSSVLSDGTLTARRRDRDETTGSGT